MARGGENDYSEIGHLFKRFCLSAVASMLNIEGCLFSAQIAQAISYMPQRKYISFDFVFMCMDCEKSYVKSLRV